MNFLELCNRVKAEGSVSGPQITNVETVTAGTEYERVVNWVKDAYKDICGAHGEWDFLRSSFTVNTVASTRAYLPTACTDTRASALIGAAAVGRFRQWWVDTFKIYKSASGVATEQPFSFEDYDAYQSIYMIGSQTNQRPALFSIRPYDDALLMGPVPDAAYVVSGDYQRRAPALAVNADEPLFDEDYHMGIVWKAVKSLATWRGDGGQFDAAEREYDRIMFELELKYLPSMAMGGGGFP